MPANLFTNQTADATGSAVLHTGGETLLYIQGSLGGGTLKLQVSHDRQNWSDLKDCSFTVAQAVSIYLPQNTNVRGVLTGSSGASLTATLVL